MGKVTMAGIAEFKAKLAQYLRIVKSGETVEIRDRNVPVAILTSATPARDTAIIAPRKDPGQLGKMTFSVKPKQRFDVVEFLIEERKKR